MFSMKIVNFVFYYQEFFIVLWTFKITDFGINIAFYSPLDIKKLGAHFFVLYTKIIFWIMR